VCKFFVSWREFRAGIGLLTSSKCADSWNIYSFGGTPKARQLLMSCLLSPVSCHALTCIQVELSPPFVCWGFMWFLVILNALAKNIILLIRLDSPKIFSWENKERGRARDVTTEGGSEGASPPAFTRTTGTSKSPSEAVFINPWTKRTIPSYHYDLLIYRWYSNN